MARARGHTVQEHSGAIRALQRRAGAASNHDDRKGEPDREMPAALPQLKTPAGLQRHSCRSTWTAFTSAARGKYSYSGLTKRKASADSTLARRRLVGSLAYCRLTGCATSSSRGSSKSARSTSSTANLLCLTAASFSRCAIVGPARPGPGGADEGVELEVQGAILDEAAAAPFVKDHGSG